MVYVTGGTQTQPQPGSEKTVVRTHGTKSTRTRMRFLRQVVSAGVLKVVCCLLIASVLLFGDQSTGNSNNNHDTNVSKDVNENDGSGNMVDVIIQFKTSPSNNQFASWGLLKKQFRGINAIAISVPANQIPVIAKLPFVKFISPDRQLKGKLDLSTAAVNAAAAVSYGLTGRGIGIAMIDSGVSPVKDLMTKYGGSRLVYSEDFTGSGTTADTYGHGTHVAGIAAGNGAASIGWIDSRTFQGIAPEANVINLKVLDSTGAGTDCALIAAID